MSHLYEVLARRVGTWRADGYPAADFPAIGEIFEWASNPDTRTLRYLRRPQLRALETAHAGILHPKIDDWRAMVDCVLIDPDCDGQVFRIGLSDIPERKTDLVAGRYEVPMGRDKRTVAVKLIDMLGEEVLTTHPLPAAGS